MGQTNRAEQQRVAKALRMDGYAWSQIAADLRARWPDLNARAAMRVAHGWNQAEAAEAWNRLWSDRLKTDKDIGVWEIRRPGFATLDKLARLYECSVADLVADIGDYRHLDAANQPGLPVVRGELATPGLPSSMVVDAPQPTRAGGTQPSAAIPALTPSLEDRALWLVGAGDPDGLEAIELRRRVEATDTGSATLAAIGNGVERSSRSYAHIAPATLLSSLRTFQAYVSRLLDGRATLAQRKELMRHAGWLSLLTATADIDLGYERAAAANFELAHSLATETGDLELNAWTFETQAWQALSTGNAQRAAELCRAGLDHARPGTSAYVQLYTQSARVSARLGEARTTRRLVDECAAAVDQLPQSHDPAHHFVCDPRRVISFCAAALVWLGDHDGTAEEYARRAVAQYEDDPGQWVHRLATARLNLALLRARSGEPAEATHLAGLALESAWRLCLTDLFLVDDLHYALTVRYEGNAEVSDFHDQYLSVRQSVSALGAGGTEATNA